MRVNEENFVTGEASDIEPSYVDVVIENHNSSEEAHPDVRKLIAETQAFYQSAKDSVAGVAESAKDSAGKASASVAECGKLAGIAANGSVVAQEAKDEAIAARDETQVLVFQAEDAASRYPYVGENGNWFVFDGDSMAFVDSGVPAQGEMGAQGEQGAQGAQGAQGEAGQDGEDGRTPVRGVDYWTEEDKLQMVEDVLSALPVAEEVAY